MIHQKAIASQICVIILVHPNPPYAFTCCLTNFLLNQEAVITTDHFCHLYVDHECDNLLLLPEVSPLLNISMNTDFVLMALLVQNE